jgi:hypothetical protein
MEAEPGGAEVDVDSKTPPRVRAQGGVPHKASGLSRDPSTVQQEAASRTYWSMIHAGRCPICSQPMTKDVRSCCTYARPCGHKLIGR